MKELFREGIDYLGCPFSDEIALADTIEYALMNLSTLKNSMNPKKRIIMHATPEKIGQKMMEDLEVKGVQVK